MFAGTIESFGQALKYSDPQPVSCTDDALHPMAGVPYAYQLDATPSGGNFTWWATKDPNFIVTSGGVTSMNVDDSLTIASGDLLDYSSNYGNADARDSVVITWSSQILSNTTYLTDPTFVAAYYEAPADSCSDNFKVFEINPINGFVVDILALDSMDLANMPAYGDVPEQCVDIVREATYTSGNLVYDFGKNYLYFEFVAANFSDHWVPTFALTGTDGVQAVSYEYTYSLPSTWGTTPPTWTALVSGTTEINVDPSVTSTEDGVSVFVRVLLENNTFETLNDQPIAMVLDGQNAEGLWDVVNDDCSDPKAADQDDEAVQVITHRPTVEEGTVSPTAPTGLVPKNP